VEKVLVGRGLGMEMTKNFYEVGGGEAVNEGCGVGGGGEGGGQNTLAEL
jgi:hypothetical protein